MSYKQGNAWVSELDVCLVSSNMIDYIDAFDVNQTDFLPSDHAPISLKIDVLPGTDIHNLFSRACQLGEHIPCWNILAIIHA